MRTTVEKFINEICLDNRLEEGMFFIDDNKHMDILQEHLQGYGLSEAEAIEMRNKVVEGRFPERQAYNKMGLLVTFPTPEYKKRAIDRGTHFEQNPTKTAPNVKFDASGNPVAAPVAPATVSPATATSVPTPSSAPVPSAPAPKPVPAPAPPTPAPTPASVPVNPAAEPKAPAPEEGPEPVPKSDPTTPSPATPQPAPSAPPIPTPAPKELDTPNANAGAVTPPSAEEAPKKPGQKQAEAEYVEKILKT